MDAERSGASVPGGLEFCPSFEFPPRASNEDSPAPGSPPDPIDALARGFFLPRGRRFLWVGWVRMERTWVLDGEGFWVEVVAHIGCTGLQDLPFYQVCTLELIGFQLAV